MSGMDYEAARRSRERQLRLAGVSLRNTGDEDQPSKARLAAARKLSDLHRVQRTEVSSGLDLSLPPEPAPDRLAPPRLPIEEPA